MDNRGLRYLNCPVGLHVRANDRGIPRRIRWRGVWRRVTAVREFHRVDDEWWREPISRLYWNVTLDDGIDVTIYHDLVDGSWFEQRYGESFIEPLEVKPPARPYVASESVSWEKTVKRVRNAVDLPREV
jgi:hypothetical protein